VVEMDIYSAVSLIQRVKPSIVIDTRNLLKVAGSKATLSRALKVLENYGFIRGKNKRLGSFH
jgi:hypothetical protein